MLKRIIDIFISLIALVVFFPVILILFFMIRWKIGSPVLFCQIRPGFLGKPFRMFKFRTMTNAKNEFGELCSDEMRMTSFGRFLRATSLDELPELWNVLKGEMSLVGPRPLLMEYLVLYSATQARRHEVRPGITGWAQINGRNAITWEEKFNFDNWYVQNWSIGLDLKILFLTIYKILKRDGINQVGEATASKFTGEVTAKREGTAK